MRGSIALAGCGDSLVGCITAASQSYAHGPMPGYSCSYQERIARRQATVIGQYCTIRATIRGRTDGTEDFQRKQASWFECVPNPERSASQ
jgi:hypothetical protein